MSDTFPSLVVNGKMMSSGGTSSGNAGTSACDLSQEVSNKIQPPAEIQTSETQEELHIFWDKQMKEVEQIDASAFKVQELPLARIKKIMKMDEDVKMISAEAPLLFAKAAQMFITELSLRAWLHTEENKRRTLQRNDIATAISKFDQFDFLIDIVPREELKPARRSVDESKPGGENLQYFYTVPQQQATQTPANQNNTATTSTVQNQVVITPGGQIVQLTPTNQTVNVGAGQQIIQIPQQQSQPQPTNNTTINNSQSTNVVISNQNEQSQTIITPQIIQQLISSSGASPSEIQSVFSPRSVDSAQDEMLQNDVHG